MLKLKTKYSQTGDTIVEVLLCIAVLGLALGTGYALTNRSFTYGLSSAERAQAQAIAQGQVELIKNAYINKVANEEPTQFNDYLSAPSSFCIDTSTGNRKATDSGCKTGLFTTAITSNNTPTNSVFTIVVSWDKTRGSSPNQTTLYYKPGN